jgi:mannose-6-phosphate isomerase-like protein (cupin superfamily)
LLDIEEATIANNDFRRVLYTGEHLQLVAMSLAPGEEIGEEVHEDRDQFFRFEEGEGVVMIDGKENKVSDDYAVIVPGGLQAQRHQQWRGAAPVLHALRPSGA